MLRLLFASSLTLLLAACATSPSPEDIPLPVTQVQPPAPAAAPEPTASTSSALPLSALQANFKALHGEKMKGVMHFTQDEDHIKAETLMDGLKPGPYIVRLSENAHCRRFRYSRKHSQLAEFMTDNNGVIHETLAFDKVTAQELLGRSLVLHTKEKHSKAVACGVVEKL